MENTPHPQPGPDWALITGAGGRLGSRLARLAATEGLGLILCGPLATPLERLARELEPLCGERCLVLPVDLATLNGAELLLQDLRERGLHVRLLAHAAALRPGGLFLDQDPTRLQEFLQLNLLTVALLCRGLGPGLLDHGGRVLLLAPATADPEANAVLARATADWLERFSAELERELAASAIRICLFRPDEIQSRLEPAELAEAAWAALRAVPSPTDTPAPVAQPVGWLARLVARLLPPRNTTRA